MLYVLPGVSKFLRNDRNIISVLGHRSVVEFIEAIDDGHANCGWLLNRLNEPGITFTFHHTFRSIDNDVLIPLFPVVVVSRLLTM